MIPVSRLRTQMREIATESNLKNLTLQVKCYDWVARISNREMGQEISQAHSGNMITPLSTGYRASISKVLGHQVTATM